MRCFWTGDTRVVGSPGLYMLGGWRQTCSRSFKDGAWEPLLGPCFQSSVFQDTVGEISVTVVGVGIGPKWGEAA
jgi:hypothetical protein